MYTKRPRWLDSFRNGSSWPFTPQSQPERFRNRSTAITSRGGRLVPERVDAVEQVWTRATGTVPEPFWFQTCGVNTALVRDLNVEGESEERSKNSMCHSVSQSTILWIKYWYKSVCFASQTALDTMGDIEWCPRCSAAVIRDEEEKMNLGYCTSCHYSFCTECHQSWHQVSNTSCSYYWGDRKPRFLPSWPL